MKQKNLKLGKHTGSVMNHLMSSNSTLPEVGKGCTILMWSDRHAYEVISVSEDKKRVVIQQYIAERVDKNGMSECQEYKYEKLNGHNEEIVWRNDAWRKVVIQHVYEKNYLQEYELRKKETGNDKAWDEMIKPLFNEYGDLMLVEGKTKVKKTFPVVSILWGEKREYYDFSF